jgi:hypothetical protein
VKFTTVDQDAHSFFRYGVSGNLVSTSDLSDSRPRGVASNAAGDTYWVPVPIIDAIPPIPTGIKLGRVRVPVYLAFGHAAFTGRFTGLGVFDDYTSNKRFDTRQETIFHMDYIIHAARFLSSRRSNIDVWVSANGQFEFQVPVAGAQG